ncbi:MAG: hypothetical protein KIT89_00390 [Microcella sp.]|uniref:hypothetical protein n=1 Tax=Microcella sp. TaxID=1913979 RepID=UPI0024C98017|nr:hypothetical protein [Microcella sp.]UYN83746.1 MAG: hypothetical protein KIT89_00390 [Microcella sp.]
MTDPTLRLPNQRFRAVLDLGDGIGTLPPIPRGFGRPELDADVDDETGVVSLFVHFPTGQLHLDVSDEGVEHHFHTARGDDVDGSPWKREPTAALLDWARQFAMRAFAVVPDLLADAEEAAEWHAAGLRVFARETGPVPLEIIEVELEGELMLLPWLGSGSVEHEHIDGDHHPIELLWDPLGVEPSIRIARAWLDPRTDAPRAAAEPGIDWNAVGMPPAEVLTWLEGVYLNHHVIAHPAHVIVQAALERLAGID